MYDNLYRVLYCKSYYTRIYTFVGKSKLEISGNELVALATSLALCISKKIDKSDLCLVRAFLSSLSTNLTLIEFGSKEPPKK